MVAELVSCTPILPKAPVDDVYVDMYVCGRLALRLAAKHKSYEKETTQEKRHTIDPGCPLQGRREPIVYHLCYGQCSTHLWRNLSIARRLFLNSDTKSITSFVVGTLFASIFFAPNSSLGFWCS